MASMRLRAALRPAEPLHIQNERVDALRAQRLQVCRPRRRRSARSDPPERRRRQRRRARSANCRRNARQKREHDYRPGQMASASPQAAGHYASRRGGAGCGCGGSQHGKASDRSQTMGGTSPFRGIPNPAELRGEAQSQIHGSRDVDHAVPELRSPGAAAARRLLEHRRNLLRRELRIRGPDERGRPGHLGRRIRGAAREPVEPSRGRLGARRGAKNDALAVDASAPNTVVPGAASERNDPCSENGARRPFMPEAATASPSPPAPSESTGRSSAAGYSAGLPRQRVIACCCDDEHAVPRGVGHRTRLHGRTRASGEADVDDPSAALHRADDSRRHVDVVHRMFRRRP